MGTVQHPGKSVRTQAETREFQGRAAVVRVQSRQGPAKQGPEAGSKGAFSRVRNDKVLILGLGFKLRARS